MIKTYKMFLALMLCALGAISVSAGDRIPLTNDMFNTYDGFGANASKIGKLFTESSENKPGEMGVASGCPFGDTNCNAWIDCTEYSKLYIKMAGCDADGNLNGTNPRVFINRTADNGQFNSDKAASNCLVIPNDGTWAADYYTKEGDDTWVVDLTKVKKDFGFCHLHSIKGSAWNTKAIVYSVEAEEASEAEKVGWVSIINNGDLEGDDVSNFFFVENAPTNEGYAPAVITDGVGKDDSRALTLTSKEGAAETWTTQVFVKFNELIPEGTQLRVAFDVKASEAAEIGTGCHGEPRAWQAGGIFGTLNVSTEWLHVDTTFVVSADQATGNGGQGLGSLAFDLNNDKDKAKTFYFDNFVCQKYKIGTIAQYASNFVLLDFGFPTNIPELVAKTGKSRLLFPTSCVTVKHGEDSFDIQEVSAFADGRFYIFIDGEDAISDWLNEGEKVTVNFTNPADEQFHLVYADGNLKGQDVKDFNDEASANEELATVTDAIPYGLIRPSLASADPEQGSFNLPNSIKEFKVTFDKPTQGDKLVAKLGDITLTVAPQSLAEEFTLTREGGDLPTGEYTMYLTNIQPEITRAEGGEISYTFGVGHVEVDPNDTTKNYIPLSYFEGCNDGGVPQGFKLYADGEPAELRQPGQSYGGGARVMTFAAGGDFTKGLYMRTWYCEYGSTTDYKLDFTAGKTYNISFNAANWTSGNRYLNFQIFKEADLENPVFNQVVNCAPALGEKKDAVKGSTKTKIAFVPEETANYVMRWVVASDANGTATNNVWQNGVILANVEVTYMPNVPGMASILLLNEALTNAKKVQEGNTTERYAGEAFTTLSDAITKYEAEGQAYTRPSDYETAAAALDAAAATMQDHHILCDNYDAAIKKAIDVVRQNEMPDGDPNKATKFTKTEKFAVLKAAVEKYNGASEWKRDTVSITWNEETMKNDTILSDWRLEYVFDVLTEDANLTPAIAELSAIANETSLLFTQGASNVHGYERENKTAGKGTGVAVLVDRLRLGGETLKALNVNDSTLIAAVDNALTDDDALAEVVKRTVKLALYDSLAANADFMKPTVTIDEETLEETRTPKSIDMTVFVKNPNIYVTTGSNYTAETVPGWVTPEGFNAPGLSTGWDDNLRNGVDVPADVTFQSWEAAYRVQQVVEDLPAGIYRLSFGYGERADNGELNDNFAYAATSDSITTETFIDESLEEVTKTVIKGYVKAQAKVIGQSFPIATNSSALVIDSLVVTDGVLYFGVNAPQKSHTFFNEVRLSIIGAAADFDYKKAADEIKQEIIEGIEPQAAQAKVRALQLFDLNGRRITTARPGIVIVKKLMSDGSVRIEKVVKK